MTRRKLSDVLRQEVQKEIVSESEQPQSSANATQSRSGNKGTRKEANSSAANPSIPINAQVNAQVAELKSALAQGAEQEKALQAQLKMLQAEVKGKQKQIETLEAQVTQVEQLKAELAEAKDYILQLSESNTQMSLTLDAMKQPKTQSKAQAQPKAQPKTQPKSQPQRTTPLALRPLPYHSVQHEPAPVKANSKSVDVGWMD